MDVNYLYLRHASLRMSEDAACGPFRIARQRLADGYAAQLHGSLRPE